MSHVLNPFSTNRNPDQVLEKWHVELDYDLVKIIQDGCGDLLTTFGYRLVGSREEYANKSISYLPKINPDEQSTNL